MCRFAGSAWDTAEGDVEVIWYIDRDDAASRATAHVLADSEPCTIVVGSRCHLSALWNHCAPYANGPILGHMGDDIVFRTPGWDARITEVFERYPDRIAFVHGNDGVHGNRLGTHGFVHRRWVDAVGHFTPDGFPHDYCDTWFTEVADTIGRRVYLPDVLTEHMHPDVGKAEYDQTYREHAAAGQSVDVAWLYQSRWAEREADVACLRKAMH